MRIKSKYHEKKSKFIMRIKSKNIMRIKSKYIMRIKSKNILSIKSKNMMRVNSKNIMKIKSKYIRAIKSVSYHLINPSDSFCDLRLTLYLLAGSRDRRAPPPRLGPGPGDEPPSWDRCSRSRSRPWSTVGVTGVTEVAMGDKGSGATGERATTLMA